jgi:tRNA(fMet)-specific endonuclease VapC
MAVSRSSLYLLDTNMVSYIANGRSQAARHAFDRFVKHDAIAISAIVEGELLYGIARKPEAARLRTSVEALLSMLKILSWDSAAARAYGIVRAQLSVAGKQFSTLDMLIAAHAVSTDAILVTHDNAFKQVHALRTVDWATDLS